MARKRKRKTILEVHWRDAVASELWTDLADIDRVQLPLCKSWGRLHSRTADTLTLLTTEAEGQASFTKIPTAWIVAEFELKPVSTGVQPHDSGS